ncbi:MAG: RusA family crossover junction endodeoxyribonuclease [Armatimonadetes bacterium]|nr:RusA family crossover junction endodeoxyribonuclease [Armatimonadota bacterium]
MNRKKKRPEEHNKWKARVAKSAKEVIPVSPTSLPVEVSITTYVTTTTIDVDNVIKPILDGMNGVAYDDDKQVYRVTSERIDLKNSICTVLLARYSKRISQKALNLSISV